MIIILQWEPGRARFAAHVRVQVDDLFVHALVAPARRLVDLGKLVGMSGDSSVVTNQVEIQTTMGVSGPIPE